MAWEDPETVYKDAETGWYGTGPGWKGPETGLEHLETGWKGLNTRC